MMDIRYSTLMILPAIFVMNQQEVKAKVKEQVNILIIISDDHSAEHLGCYGNNDVVTPNIDALASQGMRFDRAYVTCPQSAPSRTSIFTGRSPVGIATSRFSAPLDISIPTFPEILSREAGYYTGVVGRNHHLDGVEDGQGGAYAATYITKNNLRTAECRFDFTRTLEDRDSPNGAQGQIDQFIEFIEKCPKDKPFFVSLALMTHIDLIQQKNFMIQTLSRFL